jgi:UDP-glucuronate 4-epimerase
MQKKVFITGIAGFIGMHVALKLKKRGDFVIGIDNMNDYYDVRLKQMRVQELENCGIECIKEDICNQAAIDQLIACHEITHIVHLAAQAGVRYSIQNPTAYVETNLDGFVKMIEVCRKHPHIKFTYASSSSVYGLNCKQPFCESDPTETPASLYAATKKTNEVVAHAYHHLYGIHVTGLRFFTVYGPWGRPDMATWIFTKNILEGKPIPVYNNGKMKRDFTYVDDVADGVVAAIDKGLKCEIINLGNNQPEELQDLIAYIEQACGKKAIKDLLPMQSGDVLETCASIDKAQELLGFFPKTSLREGIDRFVNWYQSYT